MVLQHNLLGLVTGDIRDQVWQKTLQEVETGALVGPIPLDQVPPEYPLSRRFGIRRVQELDVLTISPGPV